MAISPGLGLLRREFPQPMFMSACSMWRYPLACIPGSRATRANIGNAGSNMGSNHRCAPPLSDGSLWYVNRSDKDAAMNPNFTSPHSPSFVSALMEERMQEAADRRLATSLSPAAEMETPHRFRRFLVTANRGLRRTTPAVDTQ